MYLVSPSDPQILHTEFLVHAVYSVKFVFLPWLDLAWFYDQNGESCKVGSFLGGRRCDLRYSGARGQVRGQVGWGQAVESYGNCGILCRTCPVCCCLVEIVHNIISLAKSSEPKWICSKSIHSKTSLWTIEEFWNFEVFCTFLLMPISTPLCLSRSLHCQSLWALLWIWVQVLLLCRKHWFIECVGAMVLNTDLLVNIA